MSIETVTALVLSAMVQLAPPERAATEKAFPGWSETVEARAARYAAIAHDVAEVAESPAEALRIVAVIHHESGFAADVDAGQCYRGVDGRSGRCDSGKAVCLAQLQPMRRKDREAARTDRKACLRQAVVAIRRSLTMCATNSPEHRYAGLSGSCSRGLRGSREIYATLRRITDRPAPTAVKLAER